MNTAKQPAKFKGAVLIMILAVMTVLIILLAGSIAVVYSAHNRAVVKYSESQGYYTARSILDNFFAELSESTDIKGSDNVTIGTYHMLDLDNNTTVAMPMCIGRALELDLYKAQVEVKDASNNYADWLVEYCDKNKDALSAQINGFEPMSPYDYTSGSDGNRTQLYQKFADYYVNLKMSNFSDSTTYSNFYKQFEPVSTVAAGNEPNVIRYDLTQFDGFGSGTLDTDGDGNPDTNSQYGKLSDNGSGKAWITVEVLERIYAVGEGSTYAERFKAGKRSEDHIVAKVTAHVIYDNEEVTTTQIWITDPPPLVDADTGLSSLGPIDTTTSITIIGDGSALDKKVHELTNNSTYSGNLYFEGSFDTGTATPRFIMTPDNAFFAGELLKINTNPPQADYLCNGALFYAKVAQLWGSGDSFGKAGGPYINLVTRRFETHSTQKEFYGRIFAEQFDVTTNDGELTRSYVESAIPTDNYTFPNSEQKIHADVYTNFLGIPADRVYVELNDATGVAKFKLNYDHNNVALATTDPKRIENIVAADGSKITVFQGISVINGVEKELIGDRQMLVNKHEEYQFPDAAGVMQTYTYFRHAGAAGANAPGTEFKVLGTDSALQMNQTPTTGITYQVQLDFTNVDKNKIDFSKLALKHNLDVDYYAPYDNTPGAHNSWELDDRYRKKFELPFVGGEQLKLIGTGEKEYYLPTHRSLYGSYFYEEITGGVSSTDFPKSFDDDTAAFSMSPDDTLKPYTFQKFLAEHAIDTEAVLAGIDPVGPVNVGAIPDMSITPNPVSVAPGGGDTVNGVAMPAWAKVISASGYIPCNWGDSSVYFIDARTNDIEIQLGTGTDNDQTFTGTYVVYGNKNVTVKVPGNQSAGFGQTVDLGTSGHCFRFMSADIYDGKWKEEIVIGIGIMSINSGEETEAPSIDWYFSSKTIEKCKLHTGGSGVTTLCGYIMAPTASFDLDTNINGIQRDVYYYGNLIPSDTGNDKYTIFGSLFCNGYNGGQHAGVCFIPRDDGYVDDGSKPMLNKDGMYRARR